MFHIYPDEYPKVSLFHENPKFKCSRTTRCERPASGNVVEGPVIYALAPGENDLFSLHGPLMFELEGDGDNLALSSGCNHAKQTE